ARCRPVWRGTPWIMWFPWHAESATSPLGARRAAAWRYTTRPERTEDRARIGLGNSGCGGRLFGCLGPIQFVPHLAQTHDDGRARVAQGREIGEAIQQAIPGVGG